MSPLPCSLAVSPAPTFASAFLADKDRIMKPEPDTFPSATPCRDTVIDALWSGSAAKRALVRLLALCILPFCLMPSLARAQATLLSEYRFDDVAWCTPPISRTVCAGSFARSTHSRAMRESWFSSARKFCPKLRLGWMPVPSSCERGCIAPL